MDAAAEGHTLTAASNCAFVELDWTARIIDQAEDRGYGRLNDAHGMNCWYLLADDTIDFTMADISVGYAMGLADFVQVGDHPPVVQAYRERLAARPAYQRAAAVP